MTLLGEGEYQYCFQESLWNGCTLKPISDTHGVYICCCLLSSSEDEGWGKRKGKKDVGVVSRIPEGGVSRIPEDGVSWISKGRASSISKGRIIAFPL